VTSARVEVGLLRVDDADVRAQRAHGREALAREGAVDLAHRRRQPDEIGARVPAQHPERQARGPGRVGRCPARVRVLLDLERCRPALLDRVAEAVQRADARVAAPREHELARAARADQLVVDEVRRHPDQRQVAAPAADQLVPGRVRDQVGEAFERDDVAVLDELVDRLAEGDDPCHLRRGTASCRSAP
jgi:hypothetical protein